MRTSESVAKLTTALSAAQGEFPPVIKDRTARVPTKSGGSYEYHYADLATIIATVAPVLAKHGLAVMQAPTMDGDSWWLLTRVACGDEWIESQWPLPRGLTAQETGSALTYARRYSVQAVLGIASETDDDGAAASRPSNGKPAAPPDPTPPARSGPVPVISEAQVKRLHAIAAKAGHKNLEVKAWLREVHGYESSVDIRRTDYENICARLEDQTPLTERPEREPGMD